ncbi:hypothetical protein C5F52_14395 [Limnohabitans sp. TS-CS-82]|uniref:HTH domain-containing protein n=1 Tax=Limnohabitans sp. TS-CS-82 TaxID=2094193 RepID=UPI000CF27A8E|nr:HTH domain-containing protein [Limnohabitans sp. TS-CS-82]PQA82761.1 hypothetical protein C5F52_14395 [Limnohabitans sp. TS-CS-82]
MTQQQFIFPEPKRDTLGSIVLFHLSRDHKGRTKGIKAGLLAVTTGIHERTLRTVISKLREEGVPVVGAPETGYYIAQTADELEECCAFLRSRAMHSLSIEARLRKVPLPALLGQLNLNT